MTVVKYKFQIPKLTNYPKLSSPVPGGACAALDAVLHPENNMTVVKYKFQIPKLINYLKLSSPVPGGACAALDAVLHPEKVMQI